MRASKGGEGNAARVLAAFAVVCTRFRAIRPRAAKGGEIPGALKLFDRRDLKGRIVPGGARSAILPLWARRRRAWMRFCRCSISHAAFRPAIFRRLCPPCSGQGRAEPVAFGDLPADLRMEEPIRPLAGT